MPLECLAYTRDYNYAYSEYNACVGCKHRHENECWYQVTIPRKLADILTINERIAILEDKQSNPEVNIVTLTKQDYQQLQRLLLSLQEKIDSHIEKTQGKNKDRI